MRLFGTKRNKALDELLEIREQQSLNTIKTIDGSAFVHTSASRQEH
jgi:hypothetical protein